MINTKPEPIQSDVSGDPLPLDDLLSMADITEEDIIAAQEWWDETASDKFKGALGSDQTGT